MPTKMYAGVGDHSFSLYFPIDNRCEAIMLQKLSIMLFSSASKFTHYAKMPIIPKIMPLILA